MGDSGIQRARHWLKANLNIWWEAEECRTRFFKAAEQLPLRNCKWSASWQEGQMQFETLRIFNSLLTSAFQGIHNWVQAINISLNTSGAILELLTFWRSDCVIYPLLLSCMVADLKSKYGLLVEFWYSISHRWIGDHEKQYMIWLSWLICGDVLIFVLDPCSQVEAAGSSTFFRRQKTRRWRREEGRCSLARLLLNSLALLLLNHVHLGVGDGHR